MVATRRRGRILQLVVPIDAIDAVGLRLLPGILRAHDTYVHVQREERTNERTADRVHDRRYRIR